MPLSRTCSRVSLGFELLEHREMLTQVPELLAGGTICSPPIMRQVGGEETLLFAGNSPFFPGGPFGCGGRLDYDGIWRTDGTADGTFPIGDSLAETIFADSIVELNDELFFHVQSWGQTAYNLYRASDAPNSATLFRQDDARIQFQLGDRLLFTCSETCSPNYSFEFPGQLIAFDGVTETVLAEVYFDPWPQDVQNLFGVGERAFFGGDGLWHTDGTPEGTVRVMAFPDALVEVVGVTSETELYFWVRKNGQSDLWISDGTQAGTTIVEDERLHGILNPSGTVWNDTLLVSATGDSDKPELFAVHGTQGVSLLQMSNIPTSIRDTYDFHGRTAILTSNSLFVTDGTPEGTARVHGPSSTNRDYSTDGMYHTDRYFYFQTRWLEPDGRPLLYQVDAFNQRKSIGGAGTRVLAATEKSVIYSYQDKIWVLNDDANEPIPYADQIGITPEDVHTVWETGQVLFSAPDGEQMKFWLTDGTPEGTAVFGDYPPETQVVRNLFAGFDNFYHVQNKVIFEGNFSGATTGVFFNRLYSLTAPSEDGLVADIDRDGEVSFADYLILANNFGKTNASFEQGDVSGDGLVDFVDFLMIAAEFGKGRNA